MSVGSFKINDTVVGTAASSNSHDYYLGVWKDGWYISGFWSLPKSNLVLGLVIRLRPIQDELKNKILQELSKMEENEMADIQSRIAFAKTKEEEDFDQNCRNMTPLERIKYQIAINGGDIPTDVKKDIEIIMNRFINQQNEYEDLLNKL